MENEENVENKGNFIKICSGKFFTMFCLCFLPFFVLVLGNFSQPISQKW